ncbi:MAG: aminopeptidase [Thermoplasmata archaeon]|nr:aminopeptidase [Thermoplasmata archaeon]
MRRAPSVDLGPEERARLRRWSAASGGASERAFRARIVLLAAEGRQDIEIGVELHLHRLTVARWRQRFLSRRMPGLTERSRSLRPGGIAPELVDRIVRAAGAPRPDGRRWTTRSLARAHGVSHATVHRLWSLHAVRPAAFDTFPRRADPALPEAPWDVVGVSLNGRSAALAVTLLPVRPGETSVGRSVGRTPPARHGPPSEMERPPGVEEAGSDLLGPFLGVLASRVTPRTRVQVVATAPLGETATLVARWRLRHPNIMVELAPDPAGWRRRAAELIGAVARRPRGQDRGRGPAEAGGALGRILADYRSESGPYEWLAGPREIAEGDAVYRLRYDLSVTGHAGFKPTPPVPDPVARAATGEESLRTMARTLVRRYLRVKPGERVTIETWTGTLGESSAIALETLRAGGRPIVLYQDEPTYWAATTEVPARFLARLGEHQKAALERTDVFVSFFGPSDRERFHSLTPATRSRLSEYGDALYRAAARSGARAVQMAIGRVSPASARMYGVDTAEWRVELTEAMRVDPRILARRAKRLTQRLASGETLTIHHANGTRLDLRLNGRRPAVSDGTVRTPARAGEWNLVTLPAGVVTVAVDESAGEGVFRSNQPSSIGLSTTVGPMAGGRWTFRSGRLERFAFDVGDELFRQSYERAPAGKDRPAAVSIGLNDRIRISPLLEDQGLGTVSLNIGRNDFLGGKNRVPWWAWLFLRGADLSVDGDALLRRGALVE